jgi:ribosomal protein S14
MLSSKKKDIKIRRAFYKSENLSKVTKFLFFHLLSRKTPESENSGLLRATLLKNSFQMKKFSKVKIRSRCLLSNRVGGVYKPYSLSRIVLREFIGFGILPGYSKAVW